MLENILYLIGGLVAGLVAGFFVARFIMKRYLTVERDKSNPFWVWSENKYLDTSEVVMLLNDMVLRMETLEEEIEELKRYSELVDKGYG